VIEHKAGNNDGGGLEKGKYIQEYRLVKNTSNIGSWKTVKNVKTETFVVYCNLWK
jgi:hypothetical protein